MLRCSYAITLGENLEFLLPRKPDREPGFRQEIRKLSKCSLYTVGAVEIGLLIHFHSSVPTSYYDFSRFGCMGLLWIVAERTKWGSSQGLLLAPISILAVTAILIAGHFQGEDHRRVDRRLECGREAGCWFHLREVGCGTAFEAY